MVEDVIRQLFQKELEDRPSIDDDMARHISEEVEKMKQEALKYQKENGETE